MSAFGDLDAAIENLRLREGMAGAKSVGIVNIASGKHDSRAMERRPQAIAGIKAWVQANGDDAAIRPALFSNFHEPDKAAEPFSVAAPIRHLDTQGNATLQTALSCIRKAPERTQTPVRKAVTRPWPKG